MPQQESALPTATLTVGGVPLVAEVASTQSAREQGLSGRSSLPDGRAMLFVFDTPGLWGIWMKDMQFPIDILWADASGTINTIKHDASPESYPAAFYPASPASYVVEVPAGFVRSHSIAIGDKIVVK